MNYLTILLHLFPCLRKYYVTTYTNSFSQHTRNFIARNIPPPPITQHFKTLHRGAVVTSVSELRITAMLWVSLGEESMLYSTEIFVEVDLFI
jgi:hypothetical protein